MTGRPINEATRWRRFEHPAAFWLGAAACALGVILHIPMYYSARSTGYRMAGMHPSGAMLTGMALIVAGLAAAFYGLLPRGSTRIRQDASRVRVKALDDARIGPQHLALLLVVSVAIVIDVMKPAALAFVAPGMTAEYGLKSVLNPHGHIPVALHELASSGAGPALQLADPLAHRPANRTALHRAEQLVP